MKTILIVEDAEYLLRFARMNLNIEGYTVLEAHTAHQGLEAALESRPDLVILDVALPQLQGWELLAQIRSHVDLHALPVLVLSDSAKPDDERRARRMGAVAYLVKPISAGQLVRHVKRALDRPPPWQEGEVQ